MRSDSNVSPHLEGQRQLKGYLQHWSFSRSPFQSGGDDWLFLGEGHREALAGLAYFAASRWKLAFLVARPTCGTTTLLHHVQQWQGLGNTAIEAVVTQGGELEPSAIYHRLHDALRLPRTTAKPQDAINTAIRVSDRKGLQTVWMIDSCDSAAVTIACELAHKHRSLSIVATTQPRDRLALSHAARMCSMRIDLEPLSPSDVNAFLNQGLKQAGAKANPFTTSAQRRLHEVTSGMIGELSSLAESSLMLGANHHLDAITADVVDATAEISRLYSDHETRCSGESNASRAA